MQLPASTMEQFMNLSEDETARLLTSDSPPEREPNFFKGPDSFTFGPFTARLYFETTKFRWVVCIKRTMKVTENSESSDSYLKFPAQDMEFVIQTIKDFVSDIRKCSISTERSEQERFLDEESSYKNAEYWNRCYCKSTPGKSLILRPYKDLNGSYFIRMLIPKESKFKNHWQGVSSSFTVPQALYLASLLVKFQAYIMVSNEETKEADEAGVNIYKPSPTIEDLNDCANVEVVWSKPAKP